MRGGFELDYGCQSDPFKNPHKGSCPSDVGSQRLGRLTSLKKMHDVTDVTLQYSFTTDESKYLSYIILPWKGYSSIKDYSQYSDSNYPLAYNCGSDWVSHTRPDNELCMDGLVLGRILSTRPTIFTILREHLQSAPCANSLIYDV